MYRAYIPVCPHRRRIDLLTYTVLIQGLTLIVLGLALIKGGE